MNSHQLNELVQELENDGEEFFGGGRLNNITDATLSIVAVFTSLAATVLVGTDAPRWIPAVVAAVPAACATLQKTLDLRGRSNWYFQYAAQVRSLATDLKYADAPNVQECARKRAELETKMEDEWSRIGRSGVTPSSGRRARGQR
jgi:hypothetical protein